MRLTQLRDQDRLTFRYTSIISVKFAIAANLIDLMQGEVVGVEVSGRVWSAVFEDFI